MNGNDNTQGNPEVSQEQTNTTENNNPATAQETTETSETTTESTSTENTDSEQSNSGNPQETLNTEPGNTDENETEPSLEDAPTSEKPVNGERFFKRQEAARIAEEKKTAAANGTAEPAKPVQKEGPVNGNRYRRPR